MLHCRPESVSSKPPRNNPVPTKENLLDGGEELCLTDNAGECGRGIRVNSLFCDNKEFSHRHSSCLIPRILSGWVCAAGTRSIRAKGFSRVGHALIFAVLVGNFQRTRGKGWLQIMPWSSEVQALQLSNWRRTSTSERQQEAIASREQRNAEVGADLAELLVGV